MIRRLLNGLLVVALALSAVTAAGFIVRDLISFVSASPGSAHPASDPSGHNMSGSGSAAMSEGHLAFAQGGRIVCATGDGGSPSFISEGPADATPVWSPDGSQVAYVALGSSTRTGIYVAKADGTDEHQIAPAAALYSRPAWSPDGKRLVLRDSIKARQGLYTVGADGGDLRRIYEGNPNTPAWSPDGQKIAFTFNKTPSTGGVYVVNPDGTSDRLIVAGRFGELAWSPDGKRLAVRSVPTNTAEALVLVDVESGKPTELVSGLASGSWSPSWSPDGKMLALVLADGQRRKLAVVSAEPGATSRDLLPGHSFTTPVWSPNGAALAVSVAQNSGDDPMVVRVKADGSGKRQDIAVGEFPSWTK